MKESGIKNGSQNKQTRNKFSHKQNRKKQTNRMTYRVIGF